MFKYGNLYDIVIIDDENDDDDYDVQYCPEDPWAEFWMDVIDDEGLDYD